jgi:TIR domain
MAKIFVSYASEDRAFVSGLAAALSAAGHAVWFDRDLKAGSFREQISAELAAADAVIVVWSVRSKASRYVLDEAERAAVRGVLLPVRIDASELPLGFGGIQTLDLSRWPGHADDERFRIVLDQIEQIAGTKGAASARPPVRFVARSLLIAAAVAAVCAPALVLLNVAKHSAPAAGIWTVDLWLADLAEALALAFVCTAPVMLWCGFQVSRFGLSRTSPVLRRAARIYALAAIAALVIIVSAVAAGATARLSAPAALAQLAFVALLATLVIGAAGAAVLAGSHILRRLRG